jgi:hypothetical protein
VPIYATIVGEDGRTTEQEVVSATDVLERAPRGARIAIREGVTFHPDVDLFICAAVHIWTLGVVNVYSRWSLHGETSAIRGSIRGVTFYNWDTEAVRVVHGRWLISDCVFSSRHPRKSALAANAVILMERTELLLRASLIRRCKHAVNFLEPAALDADACRFEELNASVRNVTGGGRVTVNRCSFAQVRCAFHFDPFVKGAAHENVMTCEPFNALPPENFDFAPLEQQGTDGV